MNLFTMKWRGNKTPKGGKIGPYEIGHMRDGTIMALTGPAGRIGTYTRTQEFGGEGKDEHTIIIETQQDSATNPDGTACFRHEK